MTITLVSFMIRCLIAAGGDQRLASKFILNTAFGPILNVLDDNSTLLGYAIIG